MNWTRLRGSAFLLLAAMIWGCAFSFQSMAAETLGPWLFNGTRFLLAGLEILALSPFLERLEGSEKTADVRMLLAAGAAAGIVLLGASVLQQAGIPHTGAGKAGFLTSLYVVLVPLAEVIVLKRRLRWHAGLAAFLAVFALFLLSKPESGRLGQGDILVILSAAAFTVHILIIDRFAGKIPAIRFSCLQFLTAGAVGILGAFLFETVEVNALIRAAVPVLYAGLVSAGLGYTCQILGQRDVKPSAAGVLLSLESVFSVVFGFLLLGERLSGRELAGCAVMFAAVLLSQRTEKTEPN